LGGGGGGGCEARTGAGPAAVTSPETGVRSQRVGDSLSGARAGSADAAVAAGERSHEHRSADARTATGSGTGSHAGFCGSVTGASPPEQHFFFGFAAGVAGFGSGAGSGFEQQHPFETFSITGQAQDAGAQPPPARTGAGPSAASAGATTAGIT
jgi:hypothetical protein